jgi:hypothetical protein
LLAQFESAEQRSKAILERVEHQLSDLVDRRARIDSDRQRDKESRAGLAPLEAQEQAARDVIRGARDQVAELDAQAERDEELERSLQ